MYNINQLKELVNNNKELTITRLQKLIQIPSVLDHYDESSTTPFGKNINDALNFMLDTAASDGFKVYNDCGFAGRIEYSNSNNKDSKIVGILGHLDVVPVGNINNWEFDPFCGDIKDGRILGRGTQDDKGPVVACYTALKLIKDMGIKLKNRIHFILGTDEETGWRGVEHYFKNNPKPDFGFSPDADFPLIYGEKGRFAADMSLNSWDDNDILDSIMGGSIYNAVLGEVKALIKKDLSVEFNDFLLNNNLKGSINKINDNLFELNIIGKSTHAMEPEKGINAGTYMCLFLKQYSNNPMVHFISDYLHNGHYLNNLALDYNDKEMGPVTLCIGIMNIKKNDTRVTLDVRYPINYDISHMKNILSNMLDKFDIRMVYSETKEPHYVNPNSDLVQKLLNSYRKYTNDFTNLPKTIGGGTYAKVMDKGVAFGMLFQDDQALEHQANESLSLDRLFQAILIYFDAILQLGEIDA